MRIVASETGPLVLRMMRRAHVVVAAHASSVTGCSHRVRFMTTDAVTVLLGLVLPQDLLGLVTRCALECARRGKRVCLMAVRTRIMPVGECRGGRDRRLLCLVTPHTRRRLGGKLVPAMAVCA